MPPPRGRRAVLVARLDGIVYRSRTTSATSTNLAFWSIDGLDVDARELRSCSAELDDLVLHHHFTVGFDD